MKGYILKKHDEGCVLYAADTGQGSMIGILRVRLWAVGSIRGGEVRGPSSYSQELFVSDLIVDLGAHFYTRLLRPKLKYLENL
jgi:hypothetical protein